jgi:hypothetical protein
MGNFKHIHIKVQCKELCPAMVQSEAISRERLRVAKLAIDYLLELYWKQSQGRLADVDCDQLATIVDELLSLENV